jgi:hypothetical protein
MRVLPIGSPDEIMKVAATILRNSLADPEKEQLIEALIADKQAGSRELCERSGDDKTVDTARSA